jgi:branched-chain amino acid transport system permease protein
VIKFLQLLSSGIALGAIYALVCLGFVIIYKATGVINFAQGAFVIVGAFLVFNFTQTWGLPFYLSIVLAMVVMAIIGVVVERLILRRMVGQPVFAVILVTFGLLIVMEHGANAIWGYNLLAIGDPWALRTVGMGDVMIRVIDMWRVVFGAVVLGAFFLFFRYSRMGVAMRATAFDAEAALAQGISARRVFALSWAIAGVVAVVAGVLLAGGGRGVDVSLGFIALRALPAMILGGLDSPGGSVVGGLIIGVTEVMTAGYINPSYGDIVGQNFHVVMPYIVMILIMMVRPYGLFGTKEVVRV